MAGKKPSVAQTTAAPNDPRPVSPGDKSSPAIKGRPESRGVLYRLRDFIVNKLEKSKGATGSVRAQLPDGSFVQLKYSVLQGFSLKSLIRRLKAGGLDSENFSELIASSIARSISKGLMTSRAQAGTGPPSGPQPPNFDRVPIVSLVYDDATGRFAVASHFLDIEGDLDEVNKVDSKATGDDRHVLTELGHHAEATSDTRPRWSPNESQAQQVCDILATSALLQDHDVNPGNLVMVKDGSIGRIDFGHAFNDLITGMGGKLTGGGGILDRLGNRVRDFFNRTTVSHANPLKQVPKIWRDYKGFVPSQMLGDSLLRVASLRSAALEGLANAGALIQEQATKLYRSQKPKDQAALVHMVRSLEAIAAKVPLAGAGGVYRPHAKDNPMQALIDVFTHLSQVVEQGHKQMAEVGVACKVQGMVKEFKQGHWTGDRDSLISECRKLLVDHKLADYEGLPWLRSSLDEKPFEGSFIAYIEAQLGPSQRR